MRKQTVDPVFGQIKGAYGSDREHAQIRKEVCIQASVIREEVVPVPERVGADQEVGEDMLGPGQVLVALAAAEALDCAADRTGIIRGPTMGEIAGVRGGRARPNRGIEVQVQIKPCRPGWIATLGRPMRQQPTVR